MRTTISGVTDDGAAGLGGSRGVLHLARPVGSVYIRIVQTLLVASWSFCTASALADSHEALPSVAEVLSGTVMEEKVADVLKGKKVTVRAAEGSKREMAVGLACLVRPGRVASLARFRSSEAIMPEEYRDASGPIDPDNPEASLEALGFGENADREVKRYLGAKAGWELSLSSEEIAGFRELEYAKGGARQAVEAELRRMFAERVRAYHSRGLDGIADFDRGKDGSSSVARDLRESTIASKGFAKIMPTAHRVLSGDFAASSLTGTSGESFYFWTRVRALGRTIFMLNQRLAADVDGGSIVVERQFYATQFFAGGQTLTALLPVQEGTLVFYVNHSFVDRWHGLGTGAKRHIGLTLINKILKQVADDYGLCEGSE